MRPMASVSLFCIGKLRDRALQELAKDYIARLSRYCRFRVEEISSAKFHRGSSKSKTSWKRRFESASIKIALDVGGSAVDSLGFSRIMAKSEEASSSTAFIIGGPEGIPAELLQGSCKKLSLSPCTFPHQLFRILFLEQLYRAFTILRNEPYHKF